MIEGLARLARRAARTTGVLTLALTLSACGTESTRNRPMFLFLSS